jgi:hypothetical protein
MLDVFKPMPLTTRAEQRSAYREFLRVRDGEPNYALRTLTRRESRMERFDKPLSRVRPHAGLYRVSSKFSAVDDPKRSSPQIGDQSRRSRLCDPWIAIGRSLWSAILMAA